MLAQARRPWFVGGDHSISETVPGADFLRYRVGPPMAVDDRVVAASPIGPIRGGPPSACAGRASSPEW